MTPELHRPWFSHYEPSVPRTVTVFDQPLYSLLDEAAARYPKRPALIFQNTSLDGHTDMTFTISRKDLKQTLAIMEEVKERTGATDVVSDVNVAKVSAIGVGMRNHSGVAARAFSALPQEGINILMISTSEIKITILIQEKYVELAVRILHDTFGLDWDIN